jgi:hypothetical protein
MFIVTACCVVASVIGCGAKSSKLDASVQGTVTIDGELAPRGNITFNSLKKGPVAVGHIFSDGSYSVRTGQGDLSDQDGGNLSSGEYVVTVVVTGDPIPNAAEKGSPPAAGFRLSAAKYADAATSDLKLTIKPGLNVIDLKLDGASSDPPPPEEEKSEREEAKSDEAKSTEAKSNQPATDETRPDSAAPETGEKQGPADDQPEQSASASSSATPATTETSSPAAEGSSDSAGGESK